MGASAVVSGVFDEAALAAWGEAFARSLRLPAVVGLSGELGAGKTTLVRAIAAGLGVRQAVTQIDPEVQPFDVFSLPERVERSLAPRKTPMLLSLGFGLVALLLASIGIYGVLAYQVAQRTREIGIRMALGSTPGDVLRLILREGMVLTGVGLAVGFLLAIGVGQVVGSMLYEVNPFDPIVFAVAPVVLTAAALAACYLPALRATKVAPIAALRSE